VALTLSRRRPFVAGETRLDAVAFPERHDYTPTDDTV
jgi:hypothetical protein